MGLGGCFRPWFLDLIDLMYEGIATVAGVLFPCFRQKDLIDLMYEGIATNFSLSIGFYPPYGDLIDLMYEGIATLILRHS